MKHLIAIILFLSLLSCSTPTEEMVTELYNNGAKKTVQVFEIKKDGKKKVITEKGFYPDSTLKWSGSYNNKMKDGLWVSYHPDGTLWIEKEYKNNQQHGIFKSYFKSGLLQYEGEYSHDEKVGTWGIYDEDGKIIKTETF